MIKVTLLTNNGKEYPFANEDSTIREFLDQNHVNYGVGVTQLDGYSLKPGDMDKTFAQFGIGETCYISCVMKADNAAKVTVIGEAVVVTSDLKLEDIETAKKYRPEALKLFKDKEQIFEIDTSDRSSGSINKYGATFSKTTDAEGHATITLQVDRTGDVAAEIQDKIGLALLNLKKIEEGFGAAIESINADKAAIAQLIEVK